VEIYVNVAVGTISFCLLKYWLCYCYDANAFKLMVMWLLWRWLPYCYNVCVVWTCFIWYCRNIQAMKLLDILLFQVVWRSWIP